MLPLLSSAYFAPIQWYQKLNRYKECYIECNDHYIKQTYRNRCNIATTQGVQVLSIPVEKFEGKKCLMRDVRISDHGNWRHIHWNALCSAYGESAFFEYYADDIKPFFTKKWVFLYDFNIAITMKMCELLDIQPHIKETKQYITHEDYIQQMPQVIDLRDVISPKHWQLDTNFKPKKYYQVYSAKYKFIPNLSILDLLMNEGNEAVWYL